MADEGERGVRWFIDLLVNPSSLSQVEDDVTAAMATIGDRSAEAMMDSLKRVFDLRMADLKESLARGLIDDKEYERASAAAAKAYDDGILKSVENLAKAGKLTDDDFIKLTKTLKLVGDTGENAAHRGTAAFETMRHKAMHLIGEITGALAGLFAAHELFHFVKESIEEFSEAEAAYNRLRGTISGLGVDAHTTAERMEQIEGLTKRMQGRSPFYHVDIARGLTQLVDISQNYTASVNNLQLVLDLAARKQISVDTSARLVGRAMTGNTTLLRRYGIVVKEGSDAIEQLRAHFKGAAENEMRTFHGASAALGNTWKDFKETVGGALVTLGGGTTILESLRHFLEALTRGIHDNRRAIAEWAGWIAKAAKVLGEDFVESIHKTAEEFRELQLAAIWIDTFFGKLPANLKLVGALILENFVLPMAQGINEFASLSGARPIDEGAIASRIKRMRSGAAIDKAAWDVAGNARARNVLDVRRLGPYSQPPSGEHELESGEGETGFDFDPTGTKAKKAEALRQAQLAAVARLAAERKKAEQEVYDATFKIFRKGYPDLYNQHSRLVESTIQRSTDAWLNHHAIVLDAARNAAEGMTDVFQNAFGLILSGQGTVSDGFRAFYRGMGALVAGAFADVARVHVKEEVALTLSETAKAFGLLGEGNVAGAAMKFKSAGEHVLAAGAWAALGGGAGAAGAALSGGSGAGAASAAGDAGAGTAKAAATTGPAVTVNVYAFKPNSIEDQDALGDAMQEWSERWGGDMKVVLHK